MNVGNRMKSVFMCLYVAIANSAGIAFFASMILLAQLTHHADVTMYLRGASVVWLVGGLCALGTCVTETREIGVCARWPWFFAALVIQTTLFVAAKSTSLMLVSLLMRPELLLASSYVRWVDYAIYGGIAAIVLACVEGRRRASGVTHVKAEAKPTCQP